MSNIKKSERKPTNVEFFTKGIELVKEIMLYVTENFGLVQLQHNVLLFAQNNQMSDYDKADLMRIAKQYDLSVENSHAYKLIDTFRDKFYELCFDFLWHITEANTVYPNSTYEVNLRKEYIWKAISKCEYMYILLQLALELNPANSEKNINKLKNFLEMCKYEVNSLKKWKKDTARLSKTAIHNEAEKVAAQELANNIAIKNAIEKEVNLRTQHLQDTAYMTYLESNLEIINNNLCEVAFQKNPKFFIDQYHDENGNRINPAIIFFPRDISPKQLPSYSSYMDQLTMTSDDKIDQLAG